MSLCICAASIEPRPSQRFLVPDPTIVLCSDTRGETTTSSSEQMRKQVDLPWGFHALLAGSSLPIAREIADLFGDCLNERPPSNARQVLKTLRRGLALYKREIAEFHLESRLGITYQEFRSTGRNTLPEDLNKEIYRELKDYRSGAELLVVGFVPTINGGGWPVMYKVQDDEVWACEHFGVIGSGTDIGESALYYRQQMIFNILNQTIYNVYEAKRLGENAPGVGRQTEMTILRAISDGSPQVEVVTRFGIEFLQKQFSKYGPQSTEGLEPLPQEYRVMVPTEVLPRWKRRDQSIPPPSRELPEGSNES